MVEEVDKLKHSVESQKNGFVKFIKEQGVVGLAVGFILGGASTALFKSLTEDILDPVISIFLGSEEGLANWSITIEGTEIMVGSFLFTLLDFIVLLLVVYIAVKVLRVDRFDEVKEDKKS